jgi:hypothetical protein
METSSSFTTSEKVLQFLQEYKAGYIMFCKPFKVHGTWSIGVGSILEISEASKLLRKVCRELYIHDKGWFVGDVEALFSK